MRVQTDISGTVTLDKKIIPDMFSDFFICPELICNCQYLQFKKKVHSIVFSLIFDFIIFLFYFYAFLDHQRENVKTITQESLTLTQ